MKAKLKLHLWTLARWFATPFFGSSILIGAYIAGGITPTAWAGLAAGLLVMAGGHSFNTFLDYQTGLDKGTEVERSAEKDYTGGQSVIATGIASKGEVLVNALGYYALSAIPVSYLGFTIGAPVIIVWIAGMLITFWYSWGKFNWTHELSLFMGTGPLAALIGAFSVVPEFNWRSIVASVPIGIALSYLGLAFDEWPDAGANLQKGVKSLAYKVWEYEFDLNQYLLAWLFFIFILHLFFIQISLYQPLTALGFAIFPPVLGCMVFLKKSFRKAAGIFILFAMMYPILLLVGMVYG